MERTNTVNRIGAFEVARTQMLRICAPLLVCLPVPSGLVGQTLADRESVARVMDQLIPSDRERVGLELPRHPETWSLVIARFAKGDSHRHLQSTARKAIRSPATRWKTATPL